jgi:excisionase family DNA binding protein
MECLLTIEDISDKLQVGKSTIYRGVHYEYIPHLKLGGALRFEEEAVRKWLKKGLFREERTYR